MRLLYDPDTDWEAAESTVSDEIERLNYADWVWKAEAEAQINAHDEKEVTP